MNSSDSYVISLATNLSLILYTGFSSLVIFMAQFLIKIFILVPAAKLSTCKFFGNISLRHVTIMEQSEKNFFYIDYINICETEWIQSRQIKAWFFYFNCIFIFKIDFTDFNSLFIYIFISSKIFHRQHWFKIIFVSRGDRLKKYFIKYPTFVWLPRIELYLAHVDLFGIKL